MKPTLPKTLNLLSVWAPTLDGAIHGLLDDTSFQNKTGCFQKLGGPFRLVFIMVVLVFWREKKDTLVLETTISDRRVGFTWCLTWQPAIRMAIPCHAGYLNSWNLQMLKPSSTCKNMLISYSSRVQHVL